MNRAEYLKVIAGGRRNKRRAAPRAPCRESSLARLQRERPEMFSGTYFYAPVMAWKSMQHVPQDWSSTSFHASKAITARREDGLASNDAQKKWVAQGSLGELSKRPGK